MVVLRQVESQIRTLGYDIQTVRITTQPIAELVSGLSEDQALAFLKTFDDLAVQEKFAANIGPASLNDSEDPATMHLLERVLSILPNLNASAIIADEGGIHWKTIRRSAEPVTHTGQFVGMESLSSINVLMRCGDPGK